MARQSALVNEQMGRDGVLSTSRVSFVCKFIVLIPREYISGTIFRPYGADQILVIRKGDLGATQALRIP